MDMNASNNKQPSRGVSLRCPCDACCDDGGKQKRKNEHSRAAKVESVPMCFIGLRIRIKINDRF
jgi:hypothetical protein